MSKQAAFKRFGKPINPQTGEAIAPHGVSAIIAITEAAFKCIAAGDYDGLESMMHPQTVEELPRAEIAAVWKEVLTEVGALEGFTDTHAELPGGEGLTEDDEIHGVAIGATVLDCEAGQVVGRVAVEADNKIVGILIVPLEHGPLPF